MTPRERYRGELARGVLLPDPAQASLVEELDRVHRSLAAPQEGGLFARLARRFGGGKRAPVRGLYVWGGVGRGKTHLVDLFYRSSRLDSKLRMHFHRFMQLVHGELLALPEREDPLRLVAGRIAARARVLCFDEFYVSDITDAMILGRLLAALFERGVTLVATSNTDPSRLYADGLQRERFLPAIELIEPRAAGIHMGGDTDYRLRVLQRDDIYRTDGDAEALLASFRALCHTAAAENVDLLVNDGPIRPRYCAEDVVWFDFEAICAGPRSQNDYIELARLFPTVILHDVPAFDARPASEDRARRFISLIDEFYDRNVKVLILAAAPIRQLYRGRRLRTAFERTSSRVIEMQGDEFLRGTHRP